VPPWRATAALHAVPVAGRRCAPDAGRDLLLVQHSFNSVALVDLHALRQGVPGVWRVVQMERHLQEGTDGSGDGHGRALLDVLLRDRVQPVP
jgi:hypothetical protein